MGLFKNETDIMLRTHDLAKKISAVHADHELTLIGVMKGGMMFTVMLMRHLTCDYRLELITARRMPDGSVGIHWAPHTSITNKHVLVVDAICDSGRTAHRVERELEAFLPKSVEFCFLLDKETDKKYIIPAPYIGFRCPDNFMVGYGLDDNEKLRGQRHISMKTDDST